MPVSSPPASGAGMIITNARLVLFDRILEGSLAVDGDVIADIGEGASALSQAIDFEGDYLVPGLVELHTDNLERHAQPRPGVTWPSANAAVLAHDNQIAGSGITTVL